MAARYPDTQQKRQVKQPDSIRRATTTRGWRREQAPACSLEAIAAVPYVFEMG